MGPCGLEMTGVVEVVAAAVVGGVVVATADAGAVIVVVGALKVEELRYQVEAWCSFGEEAQGGEVVMRHSYCGVEYEMAMLAILVHNESEGKMAAEML